MDVEAARKLRLAEVERKQKERVKELRKYRAAEEENNEIKAEARGLVAAAVQDWARKYTPSKLSTASRKSHPDVIKLLINLHQIFPLPDGQKPQFFYL